MRVNFNVPDDLVNRIDTYAKQNYSSRSSVMCQACNQFLLSYEVTSVFSEMKNVLHSLSENIDNKVGDDETLKQIEELKVLCNAFSNASIMK